MVIYTAYCVTVPMAVATMRVAKAVDGTSQLSYHEVRMACPRGVRHATRCV